MKNIIANNILKLLKDQYLDKIDKVILKNPYEVLIFTILSAQTTDIIVSKVVKKLFVIYPNVKSLSKANIADLEKLIFSCGFYHKKANMLINTSTMICNYFDGVVPSTMNDLLKLHGVGRKTANLVLNYGFSKNVGIAVDTHVKRISIRLNLSTSKNSIKIEKDLMSIYDCKDWSLINPLFIYFGRNVCLSRHPKCNICILNKFCFYNR